MNALAMFRNGMDTSAIKSALRASGRVVDEAYVYNEIHRLREAERSGCVPVEHYVKPEYPKTKVPYAGKERLMPTEWAR